MEVPHIDAEEGNENFRRNRESGVRYVK